MSGKSLEPSSPTTLLNQVHVAAPCLESWDAMPGGDRVRSCERCQHRVYNLSEMTAVEAEALLRKTEGRLCVRFYRRNDGTIMTKDCPVGVQAVRQRFISAATAVAASVAFACGANILSKPRSEQPRWVQLAMSVIAPENAEPQRTPFELPMVPTQPVMGTPAPVAPPHRSEVTMGVMVAAPAEHTMGKISVTPK